MQNNWALKCATTQVIRHYCWSKTKAWWTKCNGITGFSPYRSHSLALYGDDFNVFRFSRTDAQLYCEGLLILRVIVNNELLLQHAPLPMYQKTGQFFKVFEVEQLPEKSCNITWYTFGWRTPFRILVHILATRIRRYCLIFYMHKTVTRKTEGGGGCSIMGMAR